MVKYYLTNGEYVDEDKIEKFTNLDSTFKNGKLIEEIRFKKLGKSISKGVKSATKITKSGFSSIVKSAAVVTDPISNELAETTNYLGNNLKGFSDDVISDSLKSFNIMGKGLKNFSYNSINDLEGAYKTLKKLGIQIGDDIEDASIDFVNEMKKLNTNQLIKEYYRKSFGTKFALAIGNVFEDVGNSVFDAVVGMIDPCYWLTGFLCPLMIHGLILSIQISMGIGSLGTETAKNESIFTILSLIIKRMVKEATTGRKGIVSNLAHKLVGSMITPIIAPMIAIMLISATSDPRYVESISGPLCVLITHALVNYIIWGDYGMSYTYFIVGFIAAFMCSGSIFGVKIEYIPGFEGFVPYFKRSLKFPGLDCSKFTNVRKLEHFTDTAIQQQIIDKLNTKQITFIPNENYYATISHPYYGHSHSGKGVLGNFYYVNYQNKGNQSYLYIPRGGLASDKNLMNITDIKKNDTIKVKVPTYENSNLIAAYYFKNGDTTGEIVDRVTNKQATKHDGSKYDKSTWLTTDGIYLNKNTGKDKDSFVLIPDIQIPDNGEFSISMRYYPTADNDGWRRLWMADIEGMTNNLSDGFGNFGIYGNPSSNKVNKKLCLIYMNGDSRSNIEIPNGFIKNKWHHLVINMKPNNEPIIYLNGELVNYSYFSSNKDLYLSTNLAGKKLTGAKVRAGTKSNYLNSGAITFGNLTELNYNKRQFKGYISSYQVFNKLLTLDDVKYWNDTFNNNELIIDPTRFIERKIVSISKNRLTKSGNKFGAGKYDTIIIKLDSKLGNYFNGEIPRNHTYNDGDTKWGPLWNNNKNKGSNFEFMIIKKDQEKKNYKELAEERELEMQATYQSTIDDINNSQEEYNKLSESIDIELTIMGNSGNLLGSYNNRNSFDTFMREQTLPIYIRFNITSPNLNKRNGMIYKRYTPLPDDFSLFNALHTTWTDSKNKFHEDFELYSNIYDAVLDKDPWKSCNFNDNGVGFSRDCGPEGYSGGDWISVSCDGNGNGCSFSTGKNNWKFTLINKLPKFIELTRLESKFNGDYNTRDKFDSFMRSLELPIYIKFDIESPKNVMRKGMIYKRLTALPDDFSLFDTLHQTWKDTNNKFNVDFSLYNSLDDAINNNNRWSHCNFNDQGIGFSRDCGPTGLSGGDWISVQCDSEGNNCNFKQGKKNWSFTLIKID